MMKEKAVQSREERRLVRKLDWILLPILTITFGLQYYDKAVLGSAAVFGIIEDLGLSQVINGAVVTTRYSTVTAAFYWGYIVAVLPMAVLFARTPLPQTAAAIVFLWGVVCILTIVVQNYEGFIAQRFFLGLMESAVGPAFIAVTCLWYKPEEQATRLGVWYSATGLFSMVSGAINYGLGSAGGPLRPWKYMYLFAGGLTIAWAFVILLFLPISPLAPGRYFSSEEREILSRRFQENPWGKDRMTLKRDQAIEALLDFKTWLYMLMAAAIYICNGAVTAFGARIVSSFGYTPLQTIAVLIPGGASTCVAIYIFSYLADKYRNITTILLPISCIPVVIGSLMIWLAPWTPRGIPLVGYYFLPTFGAPYVLLLSLGSANVIGSTKKAITSGAIFIGYNVGNIVAAYLVFTQEAAIRYRSTWIAVIVSMAATTIGSLTLRYLYARENRRRDAASAPQLPLGTVAADGKEPADSKSTVPDLASNVVEYVDLTDRQRGEFRYSL